MDSTILPGGLSTPHISPVPVPVPSPASVTFWAGASLVQVRRVGASGGELVGGGVRGVVAGFSADSRRRLQRLVAQLRRDCLPVFVTLTYPGEWSEDWSRWKRDLDVWFKRLGRRYPGSSAVWKLEPQKRGAPHFHLLLWGVPATLEARRWVSSSWYESVNSGDVRHLRAGTSVEAIRSPRGVIAYTAKYLSKEVVARSWPAGVGRWWGVFARARLPLGVAVVVELAGKVATDLMRYVVRQAGLRGRDRRLKEARRRAEARRKGRDPGPRRPGRAHGYRSLSCVCDASAWMGSLWGSLGLLPAEAGAVVDKMR